MTSPILDTPLVSLHQSSGATLGDWFGCRLPSQFSGFDAEYRALRESVGLLDKNYHAYFAFTGPDRARYLHAILTSNIRDLAPGHGLLSLFLTIQGHILAEMEILALPESLLAVSYASILESLAAAFDKYIIMDDITLSDETPTTGTLALEGPLSSAVFSDLAGPDLASFSQLDHAEAVIAGIPCRIVRCSPGGVPGAEFIAANENLPALWHALADAVAKRGGCAAGYNALNSLRLEQAIPWFTYDFDQTSLPHEASLENSHISFTKGCYIGQEIVERVRSRGHVNRRLALVECSSAVPPPRGAEVTAAGAAVGRITRSGFSPLRAHPIALAYLRREFNALGSQVSYAGGAATVIAPPLAPTA